MSGWERRAMLRAWILLSAFLVMVGAVNVFSSVQDHARIGRPIAVWEPAVWEGTSVFCLMLLAPLAYFAVRLAPPEPGRWLRFIGVHIVANLAYSFLHVVGMLALRSLAYALAGEHYGDSLASFPYEWRKDLLSYVLMASAFWLTRRLAEPRAATAPTAASFDIQDGARLLRAPVADILAACSAGNYVEFILADGRRPLMRATLARIEAELGPQGLVRTHRSWLVNAARVRALAPEGSGDWRVELEGGVEAPLSRRFPSALQQLRAKDVTPHFPRPRR